MNYWLSFGSSAVSGLAPTFIHFRTTAGGTLPPPAITEPGSFGMYYFGYTALTQIAFICDGATSGLAFSDRYVQGVLDPFDNFGFTLTTIGNTAIALGTTNVAIGTTLIGYGTSLFAFGSTNYGYGVSNYALGTSIYALGVSNLAMGTSNLAQGVSILAIGVSSFALGVSNLAQGATLVSNLGGTASSFGTDSVDPTTVFGFLKRALEDREGNETYTKSTGSLTIYSRGSSQLLATKTIADSTTETTKT